MSLKKLPIIINGKIIANEITNELKCKIEKLHLKP